LTRKQIIVITAVVLVVAVIVAGFKILISSGTSGMPEHLTIAQATGEMAGQAVKVGGDVVPGSVSWDGASASLKFTLAGEDDRMQVVYRGVAPNDFKPGAPLVVEGSYTTSGVFLATSLTTTSSPLCKTCHG
jgi:cytochrome c-type biogenesis protein CcmE